MKLNKLLIVSILLLAIFSLGTVCAVSNNVTVDETVVVEETDDTISTVNNEEIDDFTNHVTFGGEVNNDSKLEMNADEVLSEGTVRPSVHIDAPDVKYGQPLKISFNLSNATGNFHFTANGKTYSGSLINGVFAQEITDYTSTATVCNWVYDGDDYYYSVFGTKVVNTYYDINVTGADYGQDAFIDLNLYNATGSVNITVGDKTYTKDLMGNKITQEFTNYAIGSNVVTVTYSGDDKYNKFTAQYVFDINLNIELPKIYNYEPAIVTAYLGDATGVLNMALGNNSFNVNIVNGKASQKIENYSVGVNKIVFNYAGDNNFAPFSLTKTFEVLGKEDSNILSSVYQTQDKNLIAICIPHAGNGTVNATINGKKEILELVDGIAIYPIESSSVITQLDVSYGGNVRLNPGNTTLFKKLDNVVNSENWLHYFNQEDGGKLYDFISSGITLDFQGSIINPDSSNELFININKPLNIVSTTKDAYIDLNTTSGNIFGEHPGSWFAVTYGGAGSNISGIYLHNTQLWISNTSNVVFDNITVVVEDQRVGSGVGITAVRDNSSYITIKNSYFYTRNNDGSTTLALSWATYCVFDNNTVIAEGDVGNLLYLNVYNIANLPGETTGVGTDIIPKYPLNVHNTFSNNILYGKEGSAISLGIMVEGAYNIIENNTLHKCSISTSYGVNNPANNSYIGNVLEEGSSLTAQPYSIIYNNIVRGTLLTGANSVAYNNTAGKITPGMNSEVYNNTVGDVEIKMDNVMFHNNIVNGSVETTGRNLKFYENVIVGQVSIGNVNTTVHDNIIYAPYHSNPNLYYIDLESIANSFYNNIVKGSASISNAYNNTFEGNVHIPSSNGSFTKNIIKGLVSIDGGKNNITNNTITSTNRDYAIILTGYNDDGNLIISNTIYSEIYSGDSAVYDRGAEEGRGSSIIKDNFPLDANLTFNISSTSFNIFSEETVSVTLNPNATGDVYLIFNDNLYKINLNEDNIGSIQLTPGMYMIDNHVLSGHNFVSVFYEGDDTYGSSFKSIPIEITKYDVPIKIDINEPKIGGKLKVTISGFNRITIPPINDMRIIVDGKEDCSWRSGQEQDEVFISCNINNISAGTHTIIVSFMGNDYINPFFEYKSFILEKTNPFINIDIDDLKLGEDAKVSVTIANATGMVNIIVDGVESAVDLVDGVATTAISKVTAGTHTVVANYAGDAKNNPVSGSVSKTLTVLSTKITDVVVDGDLNINAVLKDSNGKCIEGATILYKMGTQNATVTTGANGTFTIKGEENAKVEISYVGSDLLFPTSTVISLSEVAPTRVASEIAASQLTCYAVDTAAGEKGAMFKVTLSDDSGKLANAKVQFALNGKIYNATTDENGIASLQVNIDKANTYTCAISYIGDVKQDAAFTAVKVIVNKKKTSLTAKAKTFKVKVKTKKYTATLKTTTKSVDGKTYLAAGKKVTITVNGKTYTAKTNKKGQVTFKIKKLNKKGKYNAVINFAGDDTYNGVTKKVKISVK